MRNIHDTINANAFLKKWMGVFPGNEKKNLVDAYQAKVQFNEFVGNNINDEYLAQKVTQFIHRGRTIFKESTYKKSKRKGDFSMINTAEVLKNISKSKNKTGNCLGTSQIGAYLLKSAGLEIKFGLIPEHIFLYSKIGNSWKPIETTSNCGFNKKPNKFPKMMSLEKMEEYLKTILAFYLRQGKKYDLALKNMNEAIKMNNSNNNLYFHEKGLIFHEEGKISLAIENYEQSINMGHPFYASFHNLGNIWKDKGKIDLAIKCYKTSIKLNPKFDCSYWQLGKLLEIKKDYISALNSFKEYTSLSNLSKKDEKKISKRIKKLELMVDNEK